MGKLLFHSLLVLYCMGLCGHPTLSHPVPWYIHWDEMDTWDWGIGHGTLWDIPIVSLTLVHEGSPKIPFDSWWQCWTTLGSCEPSCFMWDILCLLCYINALSKQVLLQAQLSWGALHSHILPIWTSIKSYRAMLQVLCHKSPPQAGVPGWCSCLEWRADGGTENLWKETFKSKMIINYTMYSVYIYSLPPPALYLRILFVNVSYTEIVSQRSGVHVPRQR